MSFCQCAWQRPLEESDWYPLPQSDKSPADIHGGMCRPTANANSCAENRSRSVGDNRKGPLRYALTGKALVNFHTCTVSTRPMRKVNGQLEIQRG